MVKYSFIVPIYNNVRLAEEFCCEFELVLRKYLKQKFIEDIVELIFVNDGSEDNSFVVLKEISIRYKFIKIVDLSRNFGHHIAVTCGYEHARGAYIGMLNVDMQDPLNQIPKLLDHIKNNDVDIVIGIRKKQERSGIQVITSMLFTYMLNKLSGYNMPLNTASIRIMNRKFTNEYNRLSEKSRYLPGLESWLGFKHGYVEIDHAKCVDGKSCYNFRKRCGMALNAILSFSDLPLRISIYMGILVAIIGFILNIILIIQKLFFVNFQPGYTSTISIIVFMGGIQILVIGISGLYIGRILMEVKNRPLYIIRQTHNMK